MDYDVVIIGAGVIGLVCAKEFSARKMNVLVIERHPSFGYETSSRNSQVIHSGMYYPTGSLKAELCIKGNRSLYSWCETHNVPFARIGKYIIATNEAEEVELENILKRGKDNGVDSLHRVSKNEIQSSEPFVKATCGLWSPNTGIVDSHQLMLSFMKEAEENNCDFAWRHTVISIHQIENGYEIVIEDPEKSEIVISTQRVVNSAGLESDTIASMVGMDVEKLGYKLHYCRGHYFRVRSSKKGLVKHLIYPVPPKDIPGLGIHITIELNGELKLGPDVEYLNKREQDYSISLVLHDKFFKAVSRYIEGLEHRDIFPDQSGIRPKLQGKGEKFRDFVIKEESGNGYSGWINLIGIESPGLTCSLEIAKKVVNLV